MNRKYVTRLVKTAGFEAVQRVSHRIRFGGAAWPEALEGRNVLVVGAGAGLGAATAIKMADNGAYVVAAGLLETPGDTTYGRDELGLEAVGVRCGLPHVPMDVCDDDSVRRGVDLASTAFKAVSGRHRIDFLVIVAGVADPGLQLDNLPRDAALQRRMYEVNVLGAQRVRRCASKFMAPGASVTQFCSMAALVPLPVMGSYAGTKAAALAELEALDQEYWMAGMSVTAVIPSMVESRMTDHGRESGAARAIRGVIERSTVKQDDAVEIIVRGIARRQRRVYVPKVLRFVDYLPPVVLRAYKLLTRFVAVAAVTGHVDERVTETHFAK